VHNLTIDTSDALRGRCDSAAGAGFTGRGVALIVFRFGTSPIGWSTGTEVLVFLLAIFGILFEGRYVGLGGTGTGTLLSVFLPFLSSLESQFLLLRHHLERLLRRVLLLREH